MYLYTSIITEDTAFQTRITLNKYTWISKKPWNILEFCKSWVLLVITLYNTCAWYFNQCIEMGFLLWLSIVIERNLLTSFGSMGCQAWCSICVSLGKNTSKLILSQINIFMDYDGHNFICLVLPKKRNRVKKYENAGRVWVESVSRVGKVQNPLWVNLNNNIYRPLQRTLQPKASGTLS